MHSEKINHPPVAPMTRNRWSVPNAKPYKVQAHHLLCAICVRGGCKTPPCGKKSIDDLLAALWSYPHLPLLIQTDLDIARAHFFDVYEKRAARSLPKDFKKRMAAYAERRKDLEICRLLGIYPNTVLPAYHAYQMIFSRQRSLQGMCRGLTADPAVWPECPHADTGCYERIVSTPRADLLKQTLLGQDMAGKGLWALFQPRSRAEMNKAKRASAAHIIEKAERLYIRPNHALCILCTRNAPEPLIQDNLVELRRRMEANPDILVTLTEGCCMVCDSCNVYHPGEHLCYHGHPKSILRDLRMLEVLGLKPGATLPARELYRLIFERIKSLKDICGWGDGTNYAPMWSPCDGFQGMAFEEAKAQGFPGMNNASDNKCILEHNV